MSSTDTDVPEANRIIPFLSSSFSILHDECILKFSSIGRKFNGEFVLIPTDHLHNIGVEAWRACSGVTDNWERNEGEKQWTINHELEYQAAVGESVRKSFSRLNSDTLDEAVTKESLIDIEMAWPCDDGKVMRTTTSHGNIVFDGFVPSNMSKTEKNNVASLATELVSKPDTVDCLAPQEAACAVDEDGTGAGLAVNSQVTMQSGATWYLNDDYSRRLLTSLEDRLNAIDKNSDEHAQIYKALRSASLLHHVPQALQDYIVTSGTARLETLSSEEEYLSFYQPQVDHVLRLDHLAAQQLTDENVLEKALLCAEYMPANRANSSSKANVIPAAAESLRANLISAAAKSVLSDAKMERPSYMSRSAWSKGVHGMINSLVLDLKGDLNKFSVNELEEGPKFQLGVSRKEKPKT